MSDRDPGPLPNRWLRCPRNATDLIAGQFLAFKTPLGSQFNDKVPDVNRFTPSMLFDVVKIYKKKLGLWIDLTNTSRFYKKSEIKDRDCKYVKLQCRGHGETPSPEQTREFISTVNEFISQKPEELVGVHCTHGFNRTGFLLTAYMVEQLDCSLEYALHQFAQKRPPGIYKQDYLEELYRRYESVDDTPMAPPRPDWCEEEEEIDYDDGDGDGDTAGASSQNSRPKSKNKRMKNKEFMPGVTGVTLFTEEPRASKVQKKAQAFCKWPKSNFPGLQPVSMDKKNVFKLSEKPYRVSWKADGVRYMMLIDGDDEVYMLDRDNCVFKVHGMKFPHNKKGRNLRDTLLDGEMVIDNEKDEFGQDKCIYRYLCYDIIRFENMNVGKEPFFPVRLECIKHEIIEPRNRAIEDGRIRKEEEPFRVVAKAFWNVNVAYRLLEDEFTRTLSHEPDGLIFQPSLDPYVAGPCEDVLKWKPSDMNSVDFKLKIGIDDRQGMVRKKVGFLYVGGCNSSMGQIELTKTLKNLDNKIIECKVENNKWTFMRERTDKSFPNSFDTAQSVIYSIMNPVTKEYLFDFIRRYCAEIDSPPPHKKMRR